MYIAKLRWEMFSISYSEIIEFDKSSGMRSHSSIRKCRQPESHDGHLTWSSQPLGIKAEWLRCAASVSQTLLSSPDGEIVWDCPFPAATSVVQFADGHQINGFGYAEHLTMSIKPWHVPINELRWGRYYDGTDAIVWIDWQGPTNKTWAFRNGKIVETAVVDDNQIVLNSDELTIAFQDRRIIREGAPVVSALSELPLLRSLLPKRTFDTYECKWLSRGKLIDRNATNREGWVIHEEIKWK